MRCPQCSHQNPDGANFCGECGTRLERLCPGCGTGNPLSNNFCHRCGQALGALPSPESRFGSPQSYTPRHLAEKILTARSALEGERKHVTVLFADIKGSLELIEGIDPEEVRTLLDPALQAMMEAVHRYEGTVNQIMGDGIMALFGAPVAHEDHAVRACYAALAMQGAIRRYTEQIQREHGRDLQIRVGLNSGEVVVRAISNDLHMDYSAVGQTTHLAARMEQLAPPGSILLTTGTLRLAEDLIQVTSLGPTGVKGLPAPVQVFELVGASPTRRRLQIAATHVRTRFVGRQRELETLGEALERAGAGHGQVVAVIGEPGMGKSRLFYEFTHTPLTQGWRILETGAVSSYGKSTAYLPVIDLLKAYFQIEDSDDTQTVRNKVTSTLLALDAALTPTLPALLTLMEVPAEDPLWQALDPSLRRQHTLDAIKRLLLRESLAQPLLLIFENLHWIDSETQAFLDSLIESLATARLLLLINYRPEYRHGWGSKSSYTQLRLDPLSPASAEELLLPILGDDASLEPLKRHLIDRTEGNPFFLEESVWALIETQALMGERGAYRLVQALPSIQVPATVQAVLAARIDRLPPEEKNLLQSAAILGRDVPFPLLRAIADLPEARLREGLNHLQTAEFLYEKGLFPEPEYTFKHALTQEVAYRSLLQERRRIIHARTLEAIEALAGDRLSDQLDRLAYHALRGEVWDRALFYSWQAGTKAEDRSAHREAVACFEQAIDALKHLPANRDTIEQAIDLRFDLRSSLIPTGEFERILACLREAETLAIALNDRRRLGQVYSYLTSYFWVVGDPDSAIESGQRALTLGLGDFALEVETNLFLGEVYCTMGDYRQAREVLGRNVSSLVGDLLYKRFSLTAVASVFSRSWLVMCLAECGEFAAGIACGEDALQVAEAVDQPNSLVMAHFGIGVLYLRKGELQKAIPVLERGLQLCQIGNLPIRFASIASALGYAYALSGRTTDAIPLLERAEERAASMRRMDYYSLWTAWLGEAYLLDKCLDKAQQFADRALELSRQYKERGHQAYVLRLLGEIAAQREPLDIEQAEAFYRQALSLAEELGMRPLVAHCYLGLGVLSRRRGRLAQARSELSSSIELFGAMDMTRWLTEAEVILAQME
jgi:class 3 adenylate cyclase/tetratricopeptide (TPR) repeat protein